MAIGRGGFVAQKDISEKLLEAYDDVFADIVNVLLFDGREILKADELVDQAPRSAYKVDGKLREIERDVAKRWCRQNIRIACVGLENQTRPDPDMPLRVIGYDGAEYRNQLNGPDRYPVVTLVLYFGHDKHWDKPKNLLGCLDVPEEFQPYVKDYEINLFEIAYLTEEQVNLFKSDFGIVADFFVQKRRNGDYEPSRKEIQHVQEMLQLLSIMTGDRRFEEACAKDSEGGPKNMCEILDKVEKQGIAKGMAEGMAKGMAKGMTKGEMLKAKEVALNLNKMGLSSEMIAQAVEVSVETVRQWLSASAN